MPVYTQLASDNFHRGNENPLNPTNWTNIVLFAGSALAVVSNVCVADPVHEAGLEDYTGVTTPNNQYSSATIGAYSNPSSTNGSAIQVWVRAATGVARSGYSWGAIGVGNGTTNLVLGVDNTPVLTLNIPSISSGDVLRLEVFGPNITALYNGVVKFTLIDTTYTSGFAGLSVDWDAVQADTSVTLFSVGSIQQSPLSFSGMDW